MAEKNKVVAIAKVKRPYEKHGMKGTRIYKIWENMKTRVSNPNTPYAKHYFGKGVIVCDRWKSFGRFYEDMKEGYQTNLTLDRIDSNGNYEPKNCRWATWQEQRENTSTNFYLEIEGRRLTISACVRLYGIGVKTIHKRLNRGWSHEDAVLTPQALSAAQWDAIERRRTGPSHCAK